jgi:hypothetical protein
MYIEEGLSPWYQYLHRRRIAIQKRHRDKIARTATLAKETLMVLGVKNPPPSSGWRRGMYLAPNGQFKGETRARWIRSADRKHMEELREIKMQNQLKRQKDKEQRELQGRRTRKCADLKIIEQDSVLEVGRASRCRSKVASKVAQ